MIGRPFRVYSMSLVERLGFKSLNNLYSELSSDEIFEWMAYDMIHNPETHDRLTKEILTERQRNYTADEEADSIKMFLSALGK